MSAKLLCATAIMAAGSFMFIDTADAQRRGGAERGGNGNVEAGQRRRNGGARQARGSRNAGEARGTRRNAQTNQTTRAARANRAPTRAAPRATARQGRNVQRPARRANRNAFNRGWRQARRWVGRTWSARPTFRDHGCTAVARRNDGNGRIIRGIYGEGYGRRACRKALNRCDNRLARRQARGRNPYAACVVAYR